LFFFFLQGVGIGLALVVCLGGAVPTIVLQVRRRKSRRPIKLSERVAR
jgi:hypothetical protein